MTSACRPIRSRCRHCHGRNGGHGRYLEPDDLLEHWRGAWAEHVNQRLADLDIDARIDHRSLEAQGINFEPQQDRFGATRAWRSKAWRLSVSMSIAISLEPMARSC